MPRSSTTTRAARLRPPRRSAGVAVGTKSERAAEVGKLVAQRAREAGIDTVVFDRGGYLYHGRVKALADGAREGGLEF